MNRHSSAETLAFSIMEIARRWGDSLGDVDEEPIFVLGAGRGSGEAQLAQRFAHAIVKDVAVDAILVSALAGQLVRVAGATWDAQVKASDGGDPTLPTVAGAHAHFFRGMCQAPSASGEHSRWGLVSTAMVGDCALYLKLIFPRAKFIFLHRDPVESFESSLRAMPGGPPPVERHPEMAVSFAEHWCQLVASFELWHKDVDGIFIGKDRAIADAPREIELYLGERLLPLASAVKESEDEKLGRELHRDVAELVGDRTRGIAERLGYRRSASRIAVPNEPSPKHPPETNSAPVHTGSRRINCAVLVPAIRYIEPECDAALWELERRGYAVKRVRGCSPIDHARSRLATAALDQGYEETVWIDADTAFDPDAVDRLRSYGLPIVAGVYSRRQPRGGLAVAPLPLVPELVMGAGGGLVEVLYAGAGFLLVRREVYLAIQRRFNLPLCDENRSRRAVPFFMPMLEDWGGTLSYLGEDYAFSRRARLCGFKIMADTTIRLGHMGMYRYGYEDAGNEIERVETYRHVFEPEKGDVSANRRLV